MSGNTTIIRHGDILLVPATVPEGATKQRRGRGRLVLAEGEATGHAHAILDPNCDLYELVAPGDVEEMGRRFLRVEQEVSLVHEEHHTLTIPPGEYEVIRQVEYEPAGLRQVWD